jgi:hypothetical protein
VAYSPPNTFAAGDIIKAEDLDENDAALTIYLHEGVVSGDLSSARWVQTRHFQPPLLDPISGLQHGLTGFQGGQWNGGINAKATFGTGLLTGKRYGASTKTWEVVPQTTFTMTLRRPSKVIFHWWMESMNGPDTGARSQGADAYMWVSEFRTSGYLSATKTKVITDTYSEEAVNNSAGFSTAGNPPGGPDFPYTLLGYGNMAGTTIFNATDTLTVGLAHLSTIDRSAILNWGIAVEAYYL